MPRFVPLSRRRESTVTASRFGARLISYSQDCAPTFLLMPSSVSSMTIFRGLSGCATSSCDLSVFVSLVHPVGDALALDFAEVQAPLGTSPQHILGRARPFLAPQVAQFCLEQTGRHFLAKIGPAVRV